MSKQSYRDLVAWQQAIELVDVIYVSTRNFPECEMFGLSIQMRRAAVSVSSNIAEGHGRFSLRDFRQFLRKARGSALELETQIIIATRQGYIATETEADLLEKSASVGRLINGLIRHLSSRLRNP
jgi:four helix bundle protein